MLSIDPVSEADRIAIIGMAGRFPGAATVDEFWDMIVAGREGLSRFDENELIEQGVASELVSHPDYVPAKGVLAEADRFDAGFFGISPREADLLDPQQRVFLECAWEALESAGHDPRAFPGRIGVFGGASLDSYLLFNLLGNPDVVNEFGMFQTQLANDKDFLATRVAYKMGLRGPAITTQTACSTSLVAVHLACQSLLSGECDMAIAGGVSINVPLKSGYLFEPGGIMSRDGHCRPFDADAGGTVAGNGVALVVLRRLEEARMDGDLVDAIILGSAINNDGSGKVGFTAPSVEGQAEVIAEALALADAPADSIGYIEAHGTGTPMGDPIEVAALTKVFRDQTDATGPCLLGSVKSNVGHLDAAAGVTGLIKASLALKHGVVPPTLHFSSPNPELRLETSPFVINNEAVAWQGQGSPRRAGVSSFGIGGTNAHVVLEQDRSPIVVGEDDGWHLLALSARTAEALARMADRMADHIEAHPEQSLSDIAHTLATRRHAFERRLAIACTRDNVCDRLRQAASSGRNETARAHPKVAFVFPGQGSQYIDMARGLYDDDPVFRRELDVCLNLFAQHVDRDLREILFPAADRASEMALAIEQTEFTQPLLFAVEYALARTLMSRGIVASAVAGHSIGEYVAACLAGVFTLEQAIEVVAARGRLMQQTPRGTMLAVFLPEQDLAARLVPEVCIAAINSPRLCVVSGPTDAVARLEARLGAESIGCRRLHTSHAFHSSLVEGAVEPFIALVESMELSVPTIPLCSNLTGTWATADQVTSAAYWGSHLRQGVRFADNLSALLSEPGMILVEVGPGESMTNFARDNAAWTDSHVATATLRSARDHRSDRDVLLNALGTLWAAGAPLEWPSESDPAEGRLVRLPGYPFQRERHWVEATHDRTQPTQPEPASGRAPVEQWTYTPAWGQVSPPIVDTVSTGQRWLVLGAELSFGGALCAAARAAGIEVLEVSAGEGFGQHDDHRFAVDPTSTGNYQELLRGLADAERWPDRIVYLWSLDARGTGVGPTRSDPTDRAFFDLLAVGQALAQDAERPPAEVVVVSRDIFAVTGEETIRPWNATLQGPVTVMPQEIPGVSTRLLDLDRVDLDSRGISDVVNSIAAPATERVIARRGRRWWGRSFVHRELTGAAEMTRLRDGGVYLISGGLGGVGLAMAGYIARSVRHPVIGLMGRRAIADDDARLVGLRELGAVVEVLCADVTDVTRTRAALEDFESRHGAVDGVIHAAGLEASGLLAGMTADGARAVMAPKTIGTLVLDEVLREHRLDFVLLCSSRTAVLGGPGQTDYCGANAFLDAFASAKAAQGDGTVLSVAWDTWLDTGMADGRAELDVLQSQEGTPFGHPLAQRIVEQTPEREVFVTRISTAESWIVDDHRMMGHGLVPGTTYMEMVRAAVASRAHGRTIEFADVLFHLPVIVPDGQWRELFTELTLGEDVIGFRVRSLTPGPSQQWIDHVTGTVSLHDATEHAPVSLEQALSTSERWEDITTESELRSRLRLDAAATGVIPFSVKGRWMSLTSIHIGEDSVVAKVDLPDEYAPDLDTYLLHPGLLDVIGGSSRVWSVEGYYLPFWYGRLRLHRGLTPHMFCHIRITQSEATTGETLSCDIDVYSDQGELLAQIENYIMKRIHDPDTVRQQTELAAQAPDGGAAAPGALASLAVLTTGMSAAEGTEAWAGSSPPRHGPPS